MTILNLLKALSYMYPNMSGNILNQNKNQRLFSIVVHNRISLFVYFAVRQTIIRNFLSNKMHGFSVYTF